MKLEVRYRDRRTRTYGRVRGINGKWSNGDRREATKGNGSRNSRRNICRDREREKDNKKKKKKKQTVLDAYRGWKGLAIDLPSANLVRV